MGPLKDHTEQDLRAELERMTARMAEAEATLKAIRCGEVDAVVVEGPQGSRIFTLQSPEEPYRILTERMNEGAATLNAEGTILFCNRRLATMVEQPPERLLGSPFASWVCQEERLDFLEWVRRALKDDVRTEGHLLRSAEAVLPVQLSLGPIPLEESGQGVCLVATDISVQKQALTEISRVNADLEASMKELEAFTYSVSHDLRAPLRHIHGFSKILMEEYRTHLVPEAQYHLYRIQEGTRRMGLLVDDLLNLARVGRRNISFRVSELRLLVDEVTEELRPEWEGRRIEWRIGSLPFVKCDIGLVKLIFQNLLSNAIKFTRPRAHAIIEVGQKDGNGGPTIFVRDNGVGFSMKYAEKLFGVFHRLHAEEDFEGTGIGLATVQRIVHKHGGRIWAEAELDKGATFYFTLGTSEEKGQQEPKAKGAA